MTNIARDLLIAQVRYSHPDSVALTAQVQGHYRLIYGSPDTAPIDDDEFASPRGGFFIAYDAGFPVGMGGWRFCAEPLGIPVSRPAEIKRMYVVKSFRGRGVARQLLQHLEEAAWAAGADALVLETGQRQPEAIRLYRAAGYVDVRRFGHYADQPEAVHLGKLR